MPQVLAPLSSLLINGVHRFALCWKIERTDGVTLYLTNHNTKLTIDGNVYTPVGSPSASAREVRDGTAGNNFTVKSYIESTAITHEDLLAGRYRDAVVTEFMVDWKYPWMGKFRNTVNRVLETIFSGEVWEAQVEDLKSRMKQKVGRVYARNCDYVFGDPDTCKFDRASLVQSDTVDSIITERRKFVLATVSAADGYYDDGTITWTSGENSGLSSEIKTQLGDEIELHVETSFKIEVGDSFDILPGCKHTKEACKTYQGDLGNFGGFPTIPGNDKLFQTPDAH